MATLERLNLAVDRQANVIMAFACLSMIQTAWLVALTAILYVSR